MHMKDALFTRIGGALALVLTLAAAPARAEFAMLSEDLTIYYEQAGSGPQTIVFIPGWTMSSRVFERQLAHFAGSPRFRAIAYDPRGQGLSSKLLTDYTYQQHGRDLGALIRKLGLTDVVLVGWSFGTFDMLAYLQEFGTTNVKAVVLLDGAPKGLGQSDTKEWVWMSYEDKDKVRESATMQALQDRPTLNVAFAKWMLEAATPENISWVNYISSQTPNLVAAMTNETGAYANYEQTLKGLNGKLPLLFVAREEWGRRVADWVKANAPAVELVIMGKHLMFWERSREFNAVLDDFLGRVK